MNNHITTLANTITTDVVYVIRHKLHIVGEWTTYLDGYIVSYLNNIQWYSIAGGNQNILKFYAII